MSLLVVKGNIVAALPMKGWYVCTVCMYEWVNISESPLVSLRIGYIYIRILYKRPIFTCFSVLYLTKRFVVETLYHCNSFVSVLLECALSLLMAPPLPVQSPPLPLLLE